MKINIIFIILWTLAVILFSVITLLILLPYIDISDCETLNKILEKTDIKDLTTLLVPLGVLISAALASTSVMKSIKKTEDIDKQKRLYDISEFYMNKAIEGLDHVYNLLKDKNNNRVIWIHASRMLVETISLDKKITEENHKKVYHIKEYEIKYKLYDILNYEDSKGMPFSFFIGLKNWEENIRSDDNLIKFADKKLNLDSVSIFIIFNFIQFRNSNDPYDHILIPTNKEELEDWLTNTGIDIIYNMRKYMLSQLTKGNK